MSDNVVPTPAGPPAPPSLARAAAVYSGLRLALFVGLASVLVVSGVPVFGALVGALLGSLVGSLVLLRRQRDQLGEALLARRERSAARRAEEARVREHVEQVRRGQALPPQA